MARFFRSRRYLSACRFSRVAFLRGEVRSLRDATTKLDGRRKVRPVVLHKSRRISVSSRRVRRVRQRRLKFTVARSRPFIKEASVHKLSRLVSSLPPTPTLPAPFTHRLRSPRPSPPHARRNDLNFEGAGRKLPPSTQNLLNSLWGRTKAPPRSLGRRARTPARRRCGPRDGGVGPIARRDARDLSGCRGAPPRKTPRR